MSRFEEYSLRDFLMLIAWSMHGILKILSLLLACLSIMITRALKGPNIAVENTSALSPSDSVVHQLAVVFEKPQAASLPPRVVDIGLQGQIKKEDEAQYNVVEAAREVSWRREGRHWYYAFGVGRRPCVYSTFEECNHQIMGFSGNRAQYFALRIDAEMFV